MGKRSEAPARMAVHPGSILKEELRERDIKQRELAARMGMQASHLSEIIRGKRNMTKTVADKLEAVLGIPSMDWMNLQLAYDYDITNKTERAGIHPGWILREELERKGINELELADETGVPYLELCAILNGERAVSTKLALMMEAFLGIKASSLLAMQSEYDMIQARRDASFMEKLSRLRKAAALL